jgi:hypothetical protein
VIIAGALIRFTKVQVRTAAHLKVYFKYTHAVILSRVSDRRRVLD